MQTIAQIYTHTHSTHSLISKTVKMFGFTTRATSNVGAYA